MLQAIKVNKVSLTTKKSCAFLHMIFLISSGHISLETTASIETMRTDFAFRQTDCFDERLQRIEL